MDRQRDGFSLSPIAATMAKGAIAGAVGVWVMDLVTWYLYRRTSPANLQREEEARVEGVDVAHAAARKLARAVGTAPQTQPSASGLFVHYALGIVPGMAYAALRRNHPGLAAGGGSLYGLALFLVHDEGMAPALGLAGPPTAYPWQGHARGFVGHVALGITTEAALALLEAAERTSTTQTTPLPRHLDDAARPDTS